MFENTRLTLDRLEKCIETWEDFDWFQYDSNFDLAKAMCKEIPHIKKIAKLILVELEEK